jgi:hypothetical protein
MSLTLKLFSSSRFFLILDQLPHLLTLTQCIPCMPLKWRKFALQVCRIQRSPYANLRLLSDLNTLQDDFPAVQNPITSNPYTISDFLDSLDFISSSPHFCSFISYAVRAEVLPDADAERVISTIINKELSAATQPDIPQQLDYHALSGPEVYPQSLHGQFQKGRRTLEAWRRGITQLHNIFEQQSHVFIPFYKKRKSLGYYTQDLLHIEMDRRVYLYSVHGKYDLTALDAVKLYHETGCQITGPMEMRHAWRYNDLKGRAYYANGGDAIWVGLFLKQIVKDILNLLPSTHTFSRYDASRVTYHPLQDGEVIITYDYSSFTTSLAELKYFLVYLARQLEGITIKVLDVYEGIQERDLGEYIYHYNETINQNAEFDVSRLDICEMTCLLVQTRNGMLGAQGNLAFSTLLHGLSISGASDDVTTTCVVGDDALIRIPCRAIDEAIICVGKLGNIAREKFHIWEASALYDADEQSAADKQSFMFLKRPLSIDPENKVQTGFLAAMPAIADVLMPADGYHVRSELPFNFLLTRFAVQWSRYLYTISTIGAPVLDNFEAEVIMATMAIVYDKFNIPHEGLPYGTSWRLPEGSSSPDVSLLVTVPPIRPEIFDLDWVELMVTRYYRGSTVTMPVLVDFSIPPGPCYGQGHFIEMCTLHRIQRVMDDLGYFEIKTVLKEITLSENTLSEYHDLVYGRGFRTTHSILCLKDPPTWYNDIIALEGPG